MNRKQRREARKQLPRKTREKVKKLDTTLSCVPKKCDECQKPFNNSDQESLDKWKIAVYDDGPIHLVCPECIPTDIKNIKH